MKFWKAKLYIISKELFQFSLFTYILLLLAETVKEGFITSFFNLNIVLGIVAISGISMIFTHLDELAHEKTEKKLSVTLQNSFVIAVIGAIIVYYKIQELETIAYAITIIVIVVVMLFSTLLFLNEE